MWHGVAPRLAEHFTVVVADLPGYGASFRPPVSADHAAHSKRALAADLIGTMAELGHDTFAVAGHDRGGRVAYRMALDNPAAIAQLAVLDIVPTGEIWARADARFAIGYWHWGFLAQPAPLPERLILADPDAFWPAVQRMGIKSDERYPEEVIAAYRAQCSDPSGVQAMCEDYRAGATIDRELDDADRGHRTIDCPVLALWAGIGACRASAPCPSSMTIRSSCGAPSPPTYVAARSSAHLTSSSRTRRRRWRPSSLGSSAEL